MKFIVLALMITTQLLARTPEDRKALLEAQTTCGNFVQFDENFLYQGFGNYKVLFEEPRNPIPGIFTLTSFDNKQIKLETLDSVLDVAFFDGHAFVLTYTHIEEWDLTTMTRVALHETHTDTTEFKEYKRHAEAWARYRDELIIAHGRLGVSVFDLKQKKITKTIDLVASQSPLESQATGITVVGKFAYIVMDSFSIVQPGEVPAFQGIVVMDLESKEVSRELLGLDPGVDAISSFGNKLFASFYGLPVWKFDITKFKNDHKLPNPDARIFRFQDNGHPWGVPAIDEKYYYTCFHISPTPTTPFAIKPIALNRKVLLLD